jgi:phage shock protein PspC (stress-responsive transcriptional regulator)
VKRFWSDMNPTLRGFLVIGVIAGAIYALSLETTLVSLFLLVRIAFFLAIAFVLYLLWRDRVREDAATWPRRAQVGFYGAVVVVLAAVGAFFWRGAAGLDAVAFVLVLAFCGFALWRVWRDQNRYV